MACIFATYSRKISTILSLFHLHFLLFWGLVTGSLTSLPMNSGNCPIRTTSLKFHESMTSVGKTVSDFTLSASSVFNFPSFVTSSSSPSSSSSSALLSLPLHSSSKKLYKKKNMNNLDKILQDDPFMNRLSFTHHHHPPTSTNTLSECSKQSKKRKDIMNDLINSNNFGNSEIVVIGLSHHTAPVDVREKLSIPETEWNHASTELCQYDSINEAAVLSTCNRFEMYLVGRNQYEAMTDALNYLLKRTNGTLNEEILRQSIFMLSGEDAIWHLMRVTAGLDSIVIGEGQILSQVKHAYLKSIQEDGKSGNILSTMMKSCISAGQRVRTETNICKGAVSVSSAAVEFLMMKLQQENEKIPLNSLNHVIIGAGKMSRLLLIHLQSHGITKVTIVNRSPDSVQHLQNELSSLNITYQPMSEMLSVVSSGDVIYTCTASTTPIITPTDLTQILENRKKFDFRPTLRFIDISVPRNIHPDCGNFPSVECFNVDDLKEIVETNMFKRKREVIDAEMILRDEILKYELWKENLGTIPMIQKLQNKAEEVRLQELSKALEKLNKLSSDELNVVNSLSKGIVTTLLRGPLLHLRKQKALDSTKLAITQLQAAFQLE